MYLLPKQDLRNLSFKAPFVGSYICGFLTYAVSVCIAVVTQVRTVLITQSQSSTGFSLSTLLQVLNKYKFGIIFISVSSGIR